MNRPLIMGCSEMLEMRTFPVRFDRNSTFELLFPTTQFKDTLTHILTYIHPASWFSFNATELCWVVFSFCRSLTPDRTAPVSWIFKCAIPRTEMKTHIFLFFVCVWGVCCVGLLGPPMTDRLCAILTGDVAGWVCSIRAADHTVRPPPPPPPLQVATVHLYSV